MWGEGGESDKGGEKKSKDIGKAVQEWERGGREIDMVRRRSKGEEVPQGGYI